VIELRDLPPRVLRLEALAGNLSREVALMLRADTFLLRQERQGYLETIQRATTALETARVALVRAEQRVRAA